MRVSVLFSIFLLCFLQVIWATPSNAQSMVIQKVVVGLKNESLPRAFRLIEQQTSFRFFYRSSDIKGINNLTLTAKSRTIEETLQELLKGTLLTFRQLDNSILIEKLIQSNYQIRGRIVDGNHNPISMAGIKLIFDNRIIERATSDIGGSFLLQPTRKGNWLIIISAPGMDSLSISVMLAEKSSIELEDIVLGAHINKLNDVIIVGKRAYIEQKIDRTVINVGSLISNDGANALEVLEKSPGVVLDASGNISFKGKAGVLVLIDGKQTYLSGTNLAGYLKSLPSSALDQIELMDNPPAKYDAGGNSGVINIKTKKSKIQGFNGALSGSFTQAHYGQTNESVNLNYRKNKVNLFSNLSYSLNHTFRKLDLGRNYFNADGSLKSAFEQTQYIQPYSNAFNGKIGLDYYLSPTTTWGFVLTGLFSPGKTKNPSINNLFNGDNQLINIVTADNTSKGSFNNKGINVNYSHQFDSLGSGLTFDIDYINYGSKNEQSFLNRTYASDQALTNSSKIISDLPTDIDILSFKTDYTHPFKKNAKIDAGLKSSYVNTDNAANYYNVIDGTGIPDYNLSNRFLYQENINAAYVNFSKSYRRLVFQTGMRLENTNAKGHQLGNSKQADSSFTRHYTNLFPTAYLSYKLDSTGTTTLVLSYGKRIGRPFYQDLNPFITISDPFTYSSGNPYLQPQFSNNYKLTYNYKSIFSGSIYYYYINDLQNEVIRQQGNIFIDGTGNIGKANYIGASLNVNVEIRKWWFLSTYAQVFKNRFRGDLFGNYLDQSSTFGEINMTNQFTFLNGWSAELSGWYITKRAGGQFINFATGQLNAGVQKKILNNKGAIKLNVRDILNTYTADGLTNFLPNANSTFRNRFYQRSFTLGFNYNFGGSANSRKRTAGAAEIEKARIKM
ncbi:TonB-dependent receptor domain-containing protein [Pedobacter duraquae]|uniref:Outer membrane receptor protein involved in Fe transport n=1 Tax=Pedobacter duraquae TaxID=425511 RepID=A0A4R6IGA2_9SPHI|nr:TonB-dependent receptor [Pedobacter duraquae]TDO20697.1 outer membrane receptor protein involved in Fe transport [Pedobacter duraquae]